MGSSNRNIKYQCTKCGRQQPREVLTAKQVRFLEIGRGGKVKRSRTTDWLCTGCRNQDPAWTQPAMAGAPGMADTRLAED